MYIDARKFEEFRKYLINRYPDRLPHLLVKGFEGIDLSDWPENYREEQRKHDQARLSRQFEIVHKRRFMAVQSSKADSSETKSKMTFVSDKRRESGFQCGTDIAPLKLRMEKNDRIIRLSNVTILGQDREIIVGTLEAHVNGFSFVASSFRLRNGNFFHMHIFFNNIETSLFRLGDKRMQPLLHFHLRETEKEKPKGIQFHLGQKMADHEILWVKKRKRRYHLGDDPIMEKLNKDLKNFVCEVDDRWSSQRKSPNLSDELEKEYEFYGVLPSKEPAAFSLTSFCLIVLVETPFVVVPLRDIEIVNLALLRPGEIDMTVIFQDFKEENVLEINSIPLESLAGMKHRLNFGNVKYYVNAEKPDWKAMVKDRADNPKKFMENGGWDYSKFEDSLTYAYYKETEFDPERAAYEEC
ncbi:hypothetical protein MKW92_019629 [Papaver armeniacum]|nr:hypothetical protein MKW92_019629 [Papaver armeniacum]